MQFQYILFFFPSFHLRSNDSYSPAIGIRRNYAITFYDRNKTSPKINLYLCNDWHEQTNHSEANSIGISCIFFLMICIFCRAQNGIRILSHWFALKRRYTEIDLPQCDDGRADERKRIEDSCYLSIETILCRSRIRIRHSPNRMNQYK